MNNLNISKRTNYKKCDFVQSRLNVLKNIETRHDKENYTDEMLNKYINKNNKKQNNERLYNYLCTEIDES